MCVCVCVCMYMYVLSCVSIYQLVSNRAVVHFMQLYIKMFVFIPTEMQQQQNSWVCVFYSELNWSCLLCAV